MQIHSFIHHASKVNTEAVSYIHSLRCVTLFLNTPNLECKKRTKYDTSYLVRGSEHKKNIQYGFKIKSNIDKFLIGGGFK
jgi:hypothetical protein